MEIQYFAPVQYYTKLLAYDQLIIEAEEHYSKGSYRNRCIIAMSNGIHALSIPLARGKNQQADIREVRPDYHEDWQKIHFRSIKTAYGSAPFYEHYEPYLERIFAKKHNFLFDLCTEIQTEMCRLLKIKYNVSFSESYRTDYEESGILDFRNRISPKTRNTDSDLHFSACHYPQVFEEKNGFLPNLSILDLLFCCGPEGIYYLNKSIVKNS